MKGHPDVLAALVSLLIDEFSAIHQYAAHEAAARNSGYAIFADRIGERGDKEREHSEELLARIYLLGGVPDMTQVRDVVVGNTCISRIENDLQAELTAIERYNAAIAVAGQFGDASTRILLEHIAAEESEHARELEGWVDQINEMGLENFLASMTGR